MGREKVNVHGRVTPPERSLETGVICLSIVFVVVDNWALGLLPGRISADLEHISAGIGAMNTEKSAHGRWPIGEALYPNPR
jgi:hypothetical protein